MVNQKRGKAMECSLGEIAYNAYGEAVGWTSVIGDPLPPWEIQSANLQDAWIAAGNAVKTYLEGKE
jgi:hypothetical protein